MDFVWFQYCPYQKWFVDIRIKVRMLPQIVLSSFPDDYCFVGHSIGPSEAENLC